ncbi:hypothetical protein E4T42_08351 [Aureobasidium subglaciale]|nr:hypothetical protein E4T42_08351 [Aureobasidium subglaciale]
MRRPISCLHCRTTKRKCTKLTGAASCEQCIRANIVCSLVRCSGVRGAQNVLAPAPEPPSSNQDESIVVIMSDTVVEELVRKYLTFIHDRPHSLFHCATLWSDIHSNQICRYLLYAICSLGASLSSEPALRHLRSRLFQASKDLLLADLEDICLAKIQTCCLLANISGAELNTQSETLFLGLANRMAQMLKLHTIDQADVAVDREVKSRVWWTLVMADNWCSNGLGLPRQLESQQSNVDLPADEYLFQSSSADDTPDSLATSRRGLWAYMITLVDLFGPIYELNRRLVQDQLAENLAEQTVLLLSEQFDDWKATLPDHMQINDSNLEYHIERNLGGSFVALHLGYFHYQTLLYFQFLDLQRPRSPISDSLARRCKECALSYSRLLATTRDRGSCEAIYVTVGHMTVISSAVLLHTLLFGHDDEVPEARHNLTTNFSALIDLKQYWPGLDKIVGACRIRLISRLSIFQVACLSSTKLNTHHIDQWMVRFLLEHSLPLEERPEQDLLDVTNGPLHPTQVRTTAASDAIACLWP